MCYDIFVWRCSARVITLYSQSAFVFILILGQGTRFILSKSIPKYTKAKNSEISFHKGDTVGQLNYLVSFGKVNLYRHCIILIHAGTNDFAQYIYNGQIHDTTVQELLQSYKQLRNSIRRCNNYVILLFSAILPRKQDFKMF